MAGAHLLLERTPITPPADDENLVSWAMKNPGAIRQLIETHNQMQNLELIVVQDGETQRIPLTTTPGGQNAVFILRL